MSQAKSDLQHLKQDIERNPELEGRATTFVERTSRLLRTAAEQKDLSLIAAYAEEMGRLSVQFGQAIASPEVSRNAAG